MTASDISEIKQLLSESKKITIVPHKNPDGDAMGSSLGLFLFLLASGHKVHVITPNDYPQFLKWLPGNDDVLIYDNDRKANNDKIAESDLIFALDFNDLSRVGDMESSLRDAPGRFVLIDHHRQPEDFANYVYSDPEMCSTAQMIYHFLEMLGETNAVTPEIATCLYVGIMTDTGSFKYASTTSKTHEVVSNLIAKGADNAQIHIKVYDNQSYDRLQLLGRALSQLHVIPELATAYIVLSQDDLNEFNFKKGDTEGVVNYALSISGIELAAIFIENQKERMVKISFRSKSAFDVNTFARKHFNGGGHINAAGGRSDLNLKETIEEFITILPNYSNDLKS